MAKGRGWLNQMLDSVYFVIFIIGLIISIGFMAGKLFQKLKIPRVLAFMLVGLFLGSAGVISPILLEKLQPIVEIALGFIGFAIGSELNIKEVIENSKKLFAILILQAMGAFILVTLFMNFFFGNLYIALIFGAIATTTAPAATLEVIRESGAQGELTQMILNIIALDDILALMLFSFVITYAAPTAIWQLSTLLAPLLEIGFSLLLGCVLGIIFAKALGLFKDETEWTIVTFAGVLLCTSLANILQLSSILSAMTFGLTMSNIYSINIKTFEERFEVILLPLFIGFFVLTGAHLNILLLINVAILVVIFVSIRAVGKVFGAYGGAKLANESNNVKNYLGLSLLSQAGAALGLAYLANRQLTLIGEPMLGLLIFNVITGSVLVMELVGPLLVKYSLSRANECGVSI